jgi:hypothetical protein
LDRIEALLHRTQRLQPQAESNVNHKRQLEQIRENLHGIQENVLEYLKNGGDSLTLGQVVDHVHGKADHELQQIELAHQQQQPALEHPQEQNLVQPSLPNANIDNAHKDEKKSD